jgi:hypothetical protein
MKALKKPAVLVLNFVSLALAVACSGSMNTPLEPSGSEALSETKVGGTTIRGRTSSGASPSAARTTADSTSPRVCVTGTNQCDKIDSDGQFELKGNFTGDVHLTFTSPLGETTGVIPGVQPGETVVVQVQIAGGTATVKIESRTGHSGDDESLDDDSADDVSDDVSDDESEDSESEDSADDDSDDQSEDDDSEDSDDDDSEDTDSEDDDSDDDESDDDEKGSGRRGPGSTL